MTGSRRITEQDSAYRQLDQLTLKELLEAINREDHTVPVAISRTLPQIEKAASVILDRMRTGGRLFYVGAGTSGRLGIVDASELPPTYGLEHGRVIGLIAGGDSAIRKAVEFAEDDPEQGWKDLSAHSISANDVVMGIAASGTTPYVAGALRSAREHGIATIALTCNPDTPVAAAAETAIEVIVGPEVVTGSTRMKAGTAQKLVLNMISTSVMVQLGRVKGNKMVDMQLTNNKLVDRGTRMVMEALGIPADLANALLLKYGSVRKAIDAGQQM